MHHLLGLGANGYGITPVKVKARENIISAPNDGLVGSF